MAKKLEARTVLRAVIPYPATLVPNQFGGFDVFFPNWPRVQTTGLNLALAKKAAREELTIHLSQALRDGEDLPRPSDPETLLTDEEEALGTRVVMVEPDKDTLLRRLGLMKRPRRTAPSGVKYEP